ncbi:MAG: hypothetical protein ACHP7N_07995 [Caulobacterales bacterium]
MQVSAVSPVSHAPPVHQVAPVPKVQASPDNDGDGDHGAPDVKAPSAPGSRVDIKA